MQVKVTIDQEIAKRLISGLGIALAGTGQDPKSVLKSLLLLMGVKKEATEALLPK